jgi:hypothetical protein
LIDSKSAEEYYWKSSSGRIHLSPDIENILLRLYNSKFWQSKSAEALSRTLIDLVLFDRLEAHQEESAARRFIIRGEQSINTPTVDPTVIVSGFADHAMGYDNAVQPKFESCSIVVEAKKGSTYNTALPQAVAYLSGIQSKRAALNLNPKWMIDTVYGIVSDGYIWQFLRLDNKKLFTSSIYSITEQLLLRSASQPARNCPLTLLPNAIFLVIPLRGTRILNQESLNLLSLLPKEQGWRIVKGLKFYGQAKTSSLFHIVADNRSLGYS